MLAPLRSAGPPYATHTPAHVNGVRRNLAEPMKLNPIKLVEFVNRRPGDFLALLEGDPRYCLEELYVLPKSREETIIMHMAKKHVWFRYRFGDAKKAREGDHFYSEDTQNFEKWIKIGCPGINPETFERYFKQQPL